MSKQFRKRVEEVEERVCPQHDGTYTLEELCRLLWQQDKRAFLEITNSAEGYMYRPFIAQFEQEDAERGAR